MAHGISVIVGNAQWGIQTYKIYYIIIIYQDTLLCIIIY